MIMQMRVKTFVLAALIMVAAVPVLAQQGGKRVRVFRVGGVPPSQEVVGLGTVRCAKSLELGFFERGIIKDVQVEEGDQVKKGKVLAKLDDDVMRADIAAKKAAIEIARQRMDRAADKMAGKKRAVEPKIHQRK